MTYSKRKKSSRQHGQKTHGWGSMKKHRGAGNRGGRGNAGSGKRADAKKPSYERKGGYLGKWGFESKSRTKVRSINIRAVCSSVAEWAKKSKAKDEKGSYSVDLAAMGFTKLIGRGHADVKLTITVPAATAKAVEAIKAAGGKVNITEPAQDAPAKDAPKETVKEVKKEEE